MIVYWAVWAAFVVLCGVGITMGAVSEREQALADLTGQQRTVGTFLGGFIVLLPAGVFGQVFSPVSLIGLVVGLVLTVLF